MAGWESFYVIVGSSGAALIGIQFVVMTLVANMPKRPPAESLQAFATPTVVHLTCSLLIATVMSVPWRSPLPASLALMTCGAGGLVYGAIVIRRIRRQTYYAPVWQDWLWYAALPCSAYAVLMVGAAVLRARPHASLFVVAAAALGLLLIGIHNAWDSVMHLVLVALEPDATTGE